MTKISTTKNPLITVITVVYNGIEFLEETIKSVINQTYNNIEYIIIDGGSTDGTMDIIKKYQDKIAYWVSEPDKGIYDAMNKGIDLAKGEWLNFMNAGDGFYSDAILEEILLDVEHRAEIIYGDTVIIDGNLSKLSKAKSANNFYKGSRFCHQSAFIKAKYHKANKYSLDYKIAGDFHFFYHAFKNNIFYKQIDKVVANFSLGGVSEVSQFRTTRENHKIVNSYGFNIKYNFYYLYLYVCIALSKAVK